MAAEDLHRIYWEYSLAHQRAKTSTGATKLRAEQERDQRWNEYVAQGGELPPLEGHDVPKPDFIQLQEGSEDARVKQLQQWLGLPEKSRTGFFGSATRRAVEAFQRTHNLTVTGVVDATTWGLLQRESGAAPERTAAEALRDLSAASRPLQFDVRGRAHGVMLALDPVEQRTYCNTFNLAMLAKLVYSEDATKADSRVPMDNLIPELNSDSRSFSPVETQGTRWRPILRVTEPGHSYLTRNLDSTSKKGQAPREGTTTPDPDGSATPVTFIDTQGRFWEGMSHAVIAMRGTWNMPEDVITDLVAAKVSWPHGSGYVSKGFFLAFEAIRSLLDDRLDHLIQGGKSTVPIFVTGHSLGGALATLVALYIRATRPAHRVILYTFAQPRVVDVTLAERHWADPMLTYYRFESPVDPVPMVPSYRTASDLIRLVGDLPDTLLPRLRDRMTWVAVSHALRGNPIRAILSGWAGSELDGLEQTVDRYKRLMVQIALDQSQGAALPSAEFFAALAAPDLDARHFGVRCRLARKGGRPGVDQAADRAIEQGEEVDHDDLNALLRHTLEGLERAATGAARAKFYEVVTGLKPLVPPDRVQLELDPRAHSMDNYMAHVLFDFEQHLMLVLGKADRRLPFSAGAVERLEHLRFHDHYFGRARFWGDRPEDVDLKAQDGVLVLW